VDATRSFVDLHTHSSASFDSLLDPLSLVARAERVGLTHVAITDHERIDGALRARDAGHRALRVIVGEEIRTREGDLIGLYLERAVAPGLSAADTAAAIREQGGLVGLPHPFDRFRASGGSRATRDTASASSLAALAGVVDYVEIHNARAYFGANERAAAFARRYGLPGVAVSDAHSGLEVGNASTRLEGDPSSAEELRALLSTAVLVTGRTSFLLRLWTPLAKLGQRGRGVRRVVPGGPSQGDRGMP
jgi:hypothetical protein